MLQYNEKQILEQKVQSAKIKKQDIQSKQFKR